MEITTMIITAVATVLIAIFTWIQFHINKRLEKIQERLSFYTGAMETHSTLMLRLEAEKHGKEIIW